MRPMKEYVYVFEWYPSMQRVAVTNVSIEKAKEYFIEHLAKDNEIITKQDLVLYSISDWSKMLEPRYLYRRGP